MSKTLKKHWSGRVQECAVSWGNAGEFGSVVEVRGGAELGYFPYLGQVITEAIVCHVGRLPNSGDVLLEVNSTPVSGLTNRDTLAVIRHFREPIRIKTVKPAPSTGCLQSLGSFPNPVTLPPSRTPVRPSTSQAVSGEGVKERVRVSGRVR
ncbi:hypothetical protein J4Q44_G00215880 [Coregonus suidteri]|uniref:Membrane-associated guanylate kinase, WW and PDZ domain-containing protein 3 n=1 Tax=Coregonus suidteri TaxID=861788 RepID=A0AAN8R0P3_9TELE